MQRSFAITIAAPLPPAHLLLRMAKGPLTFANVSRVRNGVAFALGEKGRESHVKADGRMLTNAWKRLGVRLYLALNQGMPVIASTMHDRHGSRRESSSPG